MDYLDRIKQIKSERRITNDELSEKTGIPLGTLSKILAGISDSPKFANIMAICEALECSINYFIDVLFDNYDMLVRKLWCCPVICTTPYLCQN